LFHLRAGEEVSWLGLVDRGAFPTPRGSVARAAISHLTVAGAAPASHRLPCLVAQDGS